MDENNPQPQNTKLYNLPPGEVLKTLQTQPAGLTDEEVKKRQLEYGLNKLTAKKKISALKIFLSQFNNTLTLILLGSVGVILFIYFFGEHETSDLVEAGLIVAITLMITILGFIQEFKAEKAVESLKKLLAFSAKVKRNGKEINIPVAQLVPGDVCILEEGEKVPADIRILEAYSLQTIEGPLTGESTPVNKQFLALEGEKQIADQKNMVFSGTVIASGRGIGVVVSTGDKTEIGKIAKQVAETEEDETPLQRQLDDIGKKIGYIILGICAVVFVFIFFFADDFHSLSLLQKLVHSFIASVALAVAAIPEGLPAVVTIALALGTQRMLKKNALVRKLNSVETLGSTDVICSDKTGTLTKGEMTVKEIYFQGTTYSVSGTGYETKGDFQQENTTIVQAEQFARLLQAGLECNNALLKDDGTISGDPTEAALLVSAAKGKIGAKNGRVFEVPFSSERKMMSVVIRNDNSYIVYTKGAPEYILKHCSKIDKDGKTTLITDKNRGDILIATKNMSTKALRTLGFAYKVLSEKEFLSMKESPEKIESGLSFLGLQGMIDPPRIEVKDLVKKCQDSGIRIIMITGDHVETAKAVAKEIGIASEALTGEELDKLTDYEFEKAVGKISIYARVNPSFKMRIVDSLKKQNHIVAMTGDGVNDAPALKKSDIGIAMGITGTDVAKEASDMVLLDDHFSTIVAAIEEGRGIYHNIRKFVHYLLACNLAEVLVVLLAVIFFQDLPLTATMLLWINVVTDGLPAVALGLDPAEKDIMKYSPKVFQSAIINKRLWIEMGVFGILLTAFTLGIYFLNLPQGMDKAKGAAFLAIVIFELVNVFLIRTKYKTPFFANKWLIISVIGTLFLQILVVSIPFTAKLFEVKHIDTADWIYISIASLILYVSFRAMQYFLNKIPSLTDKQIQRAVVSIPPIPYTK